MNRGLFPQVGNDDRGATIDPSGSYRYDLWRRWDDRPGVNWIMLNPSTADAAKDDHTIRRCVALSKEWGYGGLVVTNLFAFRSTDPAGLKKAADPVGPANDEFIAMHARNFVIVVVAWGAHGGLLGRDRAVRERLHGMQVRPMALRQNIAGVPFHPLRLPSSLKLFPWDGRARR